jgi:hypothetical protein
MNLSIVFKVLRKGYVLTNAATWKNAQVLITAVIGLLAVANEAGLIPASLTGSTETLGTAIGTILFAAYNIYSILATSDKVGIGKHKAPADSIDNQTS